jgi:hypothetical protein
VTKNGNRSTSSAQVFTEEMALFLYVKSNEWLVTWLFTPSTRRQAFLHGFWHVHKHPTTYFFVEIPASLGTGGSCL